MTVKDALTLEELIASLEKDHTVIRNSLVELREAFLDQKVDKILDLMVQIKNIVLQHEGIEEGTILKSLIETVGKEKSGGPIRTFHQHRVIEGAIDQIESLAETCPKELTPIVYDKFHGILSEHIIEEDRYIFPFLIYMMNEKNKHILSPAITTK